MRLSLPNLPKDRDTITNPERGFLDAATYSNFPVDENSSSCQKAVRRSNFHEAGQRLMEALFTGPLVETNILKRLFIYASEDIGPANPSLIMMIDNLLDVDNKTCNPGNQVFAMRAIELLAKSPKDRLFDWMCGSIEQLSYNNISYDMLTSDDTFTCLRTCLMKLETALQDGNMVIAHEMAGQIYLLDQVKTDFKLTTEHVTILKGDIKGPKIFKKFAKISSQFWLPVLAVAVNDSKSQKICNLVCYLYQIACRRSGRFQFRGKNGMLLFWMHAIWVLCHKDEVIETWWEDRKFKHIMPLVPEEEIIRMIVSYRRRENLLGIPDYALDKHTKTGSIMGRGLKHFILIGARLKDTIPERREEQLEWLNKCIVKWKKDGKLKEDFAIPEDYFL